MSPFHSTSEQINEIATALCKAQAKIQNVKADSDNPYFKSKYADLGSVFDVIREPFTENNLSYIQLPSYDGKFVYVVTRLMHSSGQWIENTLALPTKKHDPQGVGSAITYGKRYSISSMAGLASENDDDGNDSSQPQQKQNYNQNQPRQGQNNPQMERVLNESLHDKKIKARDQFLKMFGLPVNKLEEKVEEHFQNWTKDHLMKLGEWKKELEAEAKKGEK